MDQKKFGIPLIALIIFVALIIGIIGVCVIFFTSSSTKNDAQQIKLSSNTVDEPVNAVVNDIDIPPVEEPDKGKEISENSDVAINAYRLAGNYDTAAKYAIYKKGDFSYETADPTLKLKIAFSQFTQDELASGTVSKASVEEKLKKVFGTSEGIQMQTVVMMDDINFRTGYNIVSYDYDEAGQNFKVSRSEVNDSDPSIVRELVTRAVQYNDRLEIYVTPLYIQTADTQRDNAVIKAYSLHSEYRFNEMKFYSPLITVDKESYNNVFVSGDSLDIDKFNYSRIKEQVAKFQASKGVNLDISALQQYKYVFAKNGDSYVLQSFVKVTPETENQNKPEEQPQEGQDGQEQNTVDESNSNANNNG